MWTGNLAEMLVLSFEVADIVLHIWCNVLFPALRLGAVNLVDHEIPICQSVFDCRCHGYELATSLRLITTY